MIKYSEKQKQKLRTIKTYISGELGLRATALLHNVGFTSLRNWISRYEALGIAGVQRKRRQAYDVEFKIKVLQRVKAEGLSNRQAGSLFNIRRFSSIADWERAYDNNSMGGLMPNHAAPRERNVLIHTQEPPLFSESLDFTRFNGFFALASQGQNLGEFFKRALAPGALMRPVHKTAWRTKVSFLFLCSFGLCGSCASAQCPRGPGEPRIYGINQSKFYAAPPHYTSR